MNCRSGDIANAISPELLAMTLKYAGLNPSASRSRPDTRPPVPNCRAHRRRSPSGSRASTIRPAIKMDAPGVRRPRGGVRGNTRTGADLYALSSSNRRIITSHTAAILTRAGTCANRQILWRRHAASHSLLAEVVAIGCALGFCPLRITCGRGKRDKDTDSNQRK